MMKTPEFWANKGPIAIALLPASLLWAGATWLRNALAHESVATLPVICIGNLSAGGTGKTPVTAFLYDQLDAMGYRPAILIRGYGGQAKLPIFVDPNQHTADLCGDEALMLAESRNVLVAHDRVAGAAAIAATAKHDVILIDDGMQHPYIAKDMCIAVFDGDVGIGNGWLLPAGPLRSGFTNGIKPVDAVIINGPDATGISTRLPSHISQYFGKLRPDQASVDGFTQDPFLAFAGIGRPKRFFATLREAGANLAHQLAFADHHPYSETDLVRLQEDAARLGASLITTKKDWVRLPVEWRDRVNFLPVSLELDQADGLIDQICRIIAEKTG